MNGCEVFDYILGCSATYFDEIEKMKERSIVVLFGAGSTAEYNLRYFEKLGIHVECFCDNSVCKIGSRVGNRRVLSLDQCKEEYKDAYYYITTQLFYSEIRKQLLDSGIDSERISECDIVIQLPWEKDFKRELEQKKSFYEELYNDLADEKSKGVLINRLYFLVTRERKYACSIHDDVQYFDRSIWNANSADVFVDGGVFDGETIKDFNKFSNGKYRRIIGFETDREYSRVAKENLSFMNDVEIVHRGLYDTNGCLKLSSGLGLMGSLEAVFDESGMFDGEKNVIEVCKLDDYFMSSDITPTIIKMDIEGAEMAALHGAESIIRKRHPKLLICIYHRKDDLIDIWKYVKECDNSYKFYLRHYSDNSTETVLFCV